MPLFLLEALERVDYEENDGMVVRAVDEEAARALAANSENENKRSRRWLDPPRSRCTIVESSGNAEIILVSNRGA